MSALLSIDLWGSKQGREGARGEAAPPSALIHQNRNNGIENFCPLPWDEFQAEQEQHAADAIINALPSRLRKKMFALRLRIEWMVKTYGVNHVGLQTMTIRENVTDRKEFEKRFKSIATNAFPKIYVEWLRVFERQQRGAWHAHVVVVTKEDIRTGTDVAALNQLLKDKNARRIPKAIYYAGLKRLASPNLKAIWKEFRRLCGIGEFKARRQKKGARFYKFDACHLLPIISTAQALATYVSKYISKGFAFRRLEDKGMRLVGSTRKVSRVCNEIFSWAGTGGRLWRGKLGILAGFFHFKSLDDFAEKFGPKWAYLLGPAIKSILLPEYDNVQMAVMDGLISKADEERFGLPPDWEPSQNQVLESHMRAYAEAKEVMFRRSSRKRDFKLFRPVQHVRLLASAAKPIRSGFKSWLDYTAGDN